ncbi:enoyl-CoA hydratase-related protein [Micromonospora polyrhachis]|uniref:Enoyl-CoA hydratase/carnithine racemase n=1 Tax=Micromonospora polyrhachis TaxID=1282883 RepID=A0A7W7SKS8_9ACTN|nr:enoyl-CoA hydratase-related protein [Micromonospora polyrhachis]MBB4956544.1 enoyl-CoA hydratase/carnithine racemase [Micromonospora polyrhachis]
MSLSMLAAEPAGCGLRAATRAGVRTIWFDRPDQRNAMTLDMFRDYYAALVAADADPQVRAIVVTGVGDWFCVGADPEALQALLDERHRDRLLDEFGFEPHLPMTLETPIVAAVNGGAAGLGLVHALYADVRFLAAQARLAAAFSRLGLIAEYGSAWLLPRLVGVGNALDLLVSGRKIDAVEALRIGLVQRVLPCDEVLVEAQAYAADLAAYCSPASIAVIRRQVWSGLETGAAEAAAEATQLMAASLAGADFAEALASRAQGRAPRFAARGGA